MKHICEHSGNRWKYIAHTENINEWIYLDNAGSTHHSFVYEYHISQPNSIAKQTEYKLQKYIRK